MKKWIFSIALLIVPIFCFAGSIQHYQAQVIKMKKVAAGGVIPDLLNENFETETTGYDDGAWNESPDATGIEAAFGVGGVTGESAAWLAQCLQIGILASTERVTIKDLSSDNAITYTRLEIILSAWDANTSSWLQHLAQALDSTSKLTWQLNLQSVSGDGYRFYMKYWDNNSAETADQGETVLALDTLYRVEIKYDATGTNFTWKIDSSEQLNQGLTGTLSAGIRYFRLGCTGGFDKTCTVHYDRAGIDADEWIGE